MGLINRFRNMSFWELFLISVILWIALFVFVVLYRLSPDFCMSCYLNGELFVKVVIIADVFLVPLTLLMLKDFFSDLAKMSESFWGLVKYGLFYVIMGILSLGAVIVSALVLGKFG